VRFWVLLLTLAGALLRFHDLGSQSLWLDEGHTYYFASLPIPDLFRELLLQDKHPPLYYLLVHLFLFFGHSEFWIRFPAALAGTLTVPLTYMAGREMAGKKAGLLGALFLTGSSLHLMMSQDSRMYTTGMDFSMLAVLFLWRAFHHGARRDWLLYGAGSVLSVYTHYLTMFLLLGANLFVLGHRDKARSWILANAGVAMALAPWFLFVFIGQARSPFTHQSPPWVAILEIFFVQVTGFTLYFPSMAFWYGIALSGAGLAAIGALRTRREGGWYLGTLVFLTSLLTFGFAVLTPLKIFEPKYLVLVSGYFWILVGLTLEGLPWKSLRLALIAALLLLNGISAMNQRIYPEWQRQDWRGAAEFLQTRVREGEAIILEPSYAYYAFTYYYREIPGAPLILIDDGRAARFDPESLRHFRRIWLVRCAPWVVDPGGNVKRLLDGTCPLLVKKSIENRNIGFRIDIDQYRTSERKAR
jgi:4-amino-4-deoxy-L-arabinose transferase-like glycosyltransferase